MNQYFLNIFLLIGIITIARAEVISFEECGKSVKNNNLYDRDPVYLKCKIHEVRVDPCPEAAKNEPCVLLKGTNATIAFDYTPDFDAQVATAKAFWVSSVDFPCPMDKEACEYTSCPIAAGRRQTYSYVAPIMKAIPTRQYKIKWQLLNEAYETCCFLMDIRIKAKKHRKI